MKTFNLGFLTEDGKNKVVEALNGKTYMEFRVHVGVTSGGWHVGISTEYDGSDIDILTLALSVIGEHRQ